MGSSEIMGLPTKKEWMNDRQARAMAIERVQGQAWTEGKHPTVRELLEPCPWGDAARLRTAQARGRVGEITAGRPLGWRLARSNGMPPAPLRPGFLELHPPGRAIAVGGPISAQS